MRRASRLCRSCQAFLYKTAVCLSFTGGLPARELFWIRLKCSPEVLGKYSE